MHIVLIQFGSFFNISGMLQEDDTVSFIATRFFDPDEVQSASINFRKGHICLLEEELPTLDGLVRKDIFENRIEELNICLQEIEQVIGPIDFVLGNLESSILAASILNKRLGIQSYDPDQIYSMRNKVEMKKTIEQHGKIAFPRFAKIDHSSKPATLKLAEKIGLPIILKPTREACSSGVMKIHTWQELQSVLDEIDNTVEYEMEEFIDEKIIHIDGIVRDGRLIFLGAAEYINDCLSWLQDKKPLGSIFISDKKKARKIIDFSVSVIEAFQFWDGVFHLEAFESEDTGRLTFLEIAPRFAGTEIPSLYKNLFNVDLSKEGILVLLQRPSEVTFPQGYLDSSWDPDISAAWLIFPAPHIGSFSITSISSPTGLKTLQRSSVPNIDTVMSVSPTCAYYAVGSFYLKGQTEEVKTDIKKICDEFKFEFQSISF